MKFLNKIIPWSTSLIILIFLEMILSSPQRIYYLGFMGLAVILLAVWQLANRRLKNKQFWLILLTPILLYIFGLIFVSFLAGSFLKHFFSFGLAAGLWIFLKDVFLRFHSKSKYQIHSLENISTHLGLITVFAASSSLFSLSIFLGLPVWLIFVIFSLLAFLLNYQLILVSNSKVQTGWPYIVVITIVLAEIFLAVSYLPTSVYVNGLIVTVSYYLMNGLARNWLLGIKTKQVVQRYLLISMITVIIILLTAKWI